MCICMPKSFVCKNRGVIKLSYSRKNLLFREMFVQPQEYTFLLDIHRYVSILTKEKRKGAQLLTQTAVAFCALHTTLPSFVPMWRQLAKFAQRAQKKR